MNNQPWYNVLIEKLLTIYNEKIIIEDQDNIIEYPEIKSALSKQFACFEYTYEVELRKFILENSSKQIIIVVKSSSTYIPYDITSGSEIIAWKLNEIFRGFNKSVLKDFSKHYQKIYDNIITRKLSIANYCVEETMQFLLLWIYGIDLAVISNKNDLADLLLKLYEDFEKMPISIKIVMSRFKDIPSEILENKGLFHKWLAQNNFDSKNTKIDLIKNDGPNIITLTHECKDKTNKIIEALKSNKIDWQYIAAEWARINFLNDKYDLKEVNISSIESQVDEQFKNHINNGYADLFFAGYTQKPITIDRILHYISCRPISRIALICIDCMGIYEWQVISNYLSNKLKCKFNFNAVHAIIPTLTIYSRQSLFSGLKPSEFKGYPEEKAFREHLKSNWLITDDETNRVKLFINANVNNFQDWFTYDYLGIVFNFLDDLIHSITFKGQNKGLVIKNLENILSELKFEEVVSKLLEKNYKIYIASDHGSIICKGNGLYADKHLVDSKAKRALIYSDYSLANEFASKTKTIIFNNEDIFGSKIAVIPEKREMFGNKDELIISHGGTHIEEVIVPFVEVLN